jgi:hypothetical protein
MKDCSGEELVKGDTGLKGFFSFRRRIWKELQD